MATRSGDLESVWPATDGYGSPDNASVGAVKVLMVPNHNICFLTASIHFHGWPTEFIYREDLTKCTTKRLWIDQE